MKIKDFDLPASRPVFLEKGLPFSSPSWNIHFKYLFQCSIGILERICSVQRGESGAGGKNIFTARDCNESSFPDND